MKELIYTPADKKLFYIAGYTDQSYNVKEIVSVLNNNRQYFLRSMKFSDNTVVKTEYILKSSRYKSMRYFWIDNVEENQVPDDVFIANNDWTMQKWIEN